MGIAYLRTPEWVKVSPIFYPRETLVSDQRAEKQNFSWDKSSPFEIQQAGAISTIWWLQTGFVISLIYQRCLIH